MLKNNIYFCEANAVVHEVKAGINQEFIFIKNTKGCLYLPRYGEEGDLVYEEYDSIVFAPSARMAENAVELSLDTGKNFMTVEELAEK